MLIISHSQMSMIYQKKSKNAKQPPKQLDAWDGPPP